VDGRLKFDFNAFLMRNFNQIVLSRALTHSGDQAWDFALPVSLALLLPGRLDLVAMVFFVSRIAHIALLPVVGSWIDRLSRLSALRMGLFAQFVGVLVQVAALFYVTHFLQSSVLGLVIGSLLCGLGSAMTSIAVAQDLVPTLFSGVHLIKINSRIRQVDLFAEIASPILAGAFLLLSTPSMPMLGLWLIAAWNLCSFFPEYFLLCSVLQKHSKSLDKPATAASKVPFAQELVGAWKLLARLPIAPAIFAYSLLWFSVLSPHGVLLTVFLKETWKMPELTLGTFRGLGAFFGVIATLLYPWLVSRLGIIASCRLSVAFQALMLLFCWSAFQMQQEWMFLGFILLSRVGLYSFSLGEQQLRQEAVPVSQRGRVNGAAGALNNFAALMILGLASFFGAAGQFDFLVNASAFFVLLSAILFAFSAPKLSEHVT
jgi:iron-regulated transporter 1